MQALAQIFILFSLILVGVFVGKKKMVSESFKSDISRLLLGIFLPCLIVKSMNFDFSKEMFYSSLTVIGVSLFVYVMSAVLSLVFTKIFKTKADRRDVFEYAIIFSNAAFMGFPVLSEIYGDKALFYAVIFNLGFNFMVWTYGIHIFERGKTQNGKKEKLSSKLKHMINPGIIAMIVGFTMFAFGLKFPAPIYRILELLGNITTPISMIFIGLILAESDVKDIFVDKMITVVSFTRLVVMPLIMFGLLSLFKVSGLILSVAVVITAMPIAANTAIFSQRHGGNFKLASLLVFQSTVFSIVTIPILVLLLK